MAERFFAPAPLADKASLEGPEAHHLIHVVRAKPGMQVVLFDGAGCEAEARVDVVSRSAVELSVLSRRQLSRERSVEITLAIPLPKGDRQRWLVEKAVELGVQCLVPLESERSVAEATPAALSRLRRTVIEACKQCGRNTLMEIDSPIEWSRYAATAAAPQRWLAQPGGVPLSKLVTPLNTASPSPTEFELAVGPEGGFTPAEASAAVARGWQTVDLGPAILRVETAAAFLIVAACIAAGEGPT